MRKTAVLLVAALLVGSAIPLDARDPNVKDINKVESELADAQQRLQNVKQRMADSEYVGSSSSDSISNKINEAVDAVKSKIKGSAADIDLNNMKMPSSLSDIGSESLSEKAGRKIRESLGRDTLIDKAQRAFNNAKYSLSSGMGNIDLSSLGEESVTERTARRVREILGQDTTRDKLQRKYLEARDALNEAKDLDFTAFPEKAAYLKERIEQFGQQAMDKINDMTTPEDEETIWRRIKGKLGLTREPTAAEKATLIAQHMKDAARDQATKILDATKPGAAGAFNSFLSKLGRGPSEAAYIAKQWVTSNPQERDAVRNSHTISNEAHEALDDLLSKLLIEVGDENAERVESIQVSVKPKGNFYEKPSFLQNIKNKVWGADEIDTSNSYFFDPKQGYDGLKDKVAELVHSAKTSTIGESMADKISALGEESYTDKATRKVREAMGRDTYSDKLYNFRDQAASGNILEMIRQRLPSSSSLSDIDLKASLSSLGEESLAEKAARKVRESLGKDTFADKLHFALEDLKSGGVMNAASNKFDDVKDMLSSFTGETRSERVARKVREALGRDTMVDKAHAKVDEAASYYHSLSSAASLVEKASDFKDSVVDGAQNIASSVGETISETVSGANSGATKSRLSTVKDAVFGNAKDNKIKAAESLLQDAIKKLEQAKKM